MRKLVLYLAFLLFSPFHPSSYAQISMSLHMGTPDKPVVGIPFSADEDIRLVRHLANGTLATREVKGHIYRSAEGLERYEAIFPSTDPAHPEPTQLAYIIDHTKHSSLLLNSRLKTATIQSLPADAAVLVTLLPLPNQPTDFRLKPQDMTSVDLGKRTEAMWDLRGRRMTTIIPAGKAGNDQPLTITDEVWVSPELKITVKQIEDNPFSGERTMELTNLRREEPSPALFQMPDGYTTKTHAAIPVSPPALFHPPTTDQPTPQIEEALNNPDPMVKNSVAFGLAVNGDHLVDAQKLAEEAVKLQEQTDSESVSMQDKVKSFNEMGILGTYWDTLGWVYYRQGKYEDAETYTRAAWELKPRNYAICLHMGIISEVQHHPQDAINFYRMALSSKIPPNVQDFVQTHLSRLNAGSSAPLATEVILALPSVDFKAHAGDIEPLVDILLERNAAPVVVFLQANPKLEKTFTPAIESALANHLPDQGPEKLLRRARIVCSVSDKHECTMHFLGSEVARNASADALADR